MNAFGRDVTRWLLMLVLTFCTGAVEAMIDSKSGAGEIVKHGLVALLPMMAALKLTLEGKGGQP